MSDEHDPVHNPRHYRGNGMEAIQVIEAFDLGFCLGNTVKYVLRAGKKGDAIEDLEKAAWYLRREIEARKGAGALSEARGYHLKVNVGLSEGADVDAIARRAREIASHIVDNGNRQDDHG